MMRTTHILSFGLVCDQRRSQFSGFFGSWSGCLFSKASLLLGFTQFSFKWPVSLQYQQEKSGSNDPSIPEQVLRVFDSPGMVYQYQQRHPPIYFSSGVNCRNHLLIHLQSPLTEKHSSGCSPGHQILLVICDHAHVKFNFILGPLSSKILD